MGRAWWFLARIAHNFSAEVLSSSSLTALRFLAILDVLNGYALVERQPLSKDKVELHKKGLTVMDLRQVLKTLRALGDMVIVGVGSSDADFRVFIGNDDLIIQSEEN